METNGTTGFCTSTTCHVEPSPWGAPQPGSVAPPRCTLPDTLLLYIPPGEHIHLPCPVHGDHVLRGSSFTC